MEQLAIIKDINIGVRDVGRPICWFDVELLGGGGALQILSLEEIGAILKKHQIYKLSDLNGKACIVDVENHIVKFKGLK